MVFLVTDVCKTLVGKFSNKEMDIRQSFVALTADVMGQSHMYTHARMYTSHNLTQLNLLHRCGRIWSAI